MAAIWEKINNLILSTHTHTLMSSWQRHNIVNVFSKKEEVWNRHLGSELPIRHQDLSHKHVKCQHLTYITVADWNEFNKDLMGQRYNELKVPTIIGGGLNTDAPINCILLFDLFRS